MHFGAAMSRNHIKETDVAKRIVIVGSMGLGASMMLKAKIKERFRNRLNILNVVPAYKLNNELVAEADYIFSTVPIKNIEDKNIIRINNVLGEEDLERIDKVIFQKTIINADIVKEIFEEENFFFDMNFKTREECLEFMTDKAIERGFMSKNAKDSADKYDFIDQYRHIHSVSDLCQALNVSRSALCPYRFKRQIFS